MAIQISRAVYLHVPKTGGTWITNYFKETGMDHCSPRLVDQGAHIHGELADQLLSPTDDLFFCFVRHPLTWLRSYWIHKVKLVPSRKHKFLDDIVDLPFNEFVSKIVELEPGYISDFFRGYTTKCRIIGKMENLREDLDNILRYLRIPYNREYLYNKPKENVNPQDSCKYSMELALAMIETEKEIIDKYDYNYLPMDIIDV